MCRAGCRIQVTHATYPLPNRVSTTRIPRAEVEHSCLQWRVSAHAVQAMHPALCRPSCGHWLAVTPREQAQAAAPLRLGYVLMLPITQVMQVPFLSTSQCNDWSSQVSTFSYSKIPSKDKTNPFSRCLFLMPNLKNSGIYFCIPYLLAVCYDRHFTSISMYHLFILSTLSTTILYQ